MQITGKQRHDIKQRQSYVATVRLVVYSMQGLLALTAVILVIWGVG